MLTYEYDDTCIYRSTDDINEILQRYDTYIVALAWEKMPRTVVRPALLTYEIEELAQRVRIKLWQTLQKRHVVNLKAYIGCIFFTEVIDLLRRRRAPLFFPLDDDEESYWEDLISASIKNTHDPADEIEQEEVLDDLTKKVAAALLQLPPRQFQAMMCALKDRIDDVLAIIDALQKSGVNIDEIHWPEAKNELQNWRVSLSIARRKLRPLKSQWAEICK